MTHNFYSDSYSYSCSYSYSYSYSQDSGAGPQADLTSYCITETRQPEGGRRHTVAFMKKQQL